MEPVYLVDGKRTPQAKAGTVLKDIDAPFMGIPLLKHLRDKWAIPTDAVDEVIIGNTGTPAEYANIARVIALEGGLHKSTSAYSVHRNCASGMEAISQAFMKIGSGRSDIIFAGGVESMSQMPLIYSEEMTEMFANLMKSKTLGKKLETVGTFRPNFLKPIIAIEKGLTDPFSGLNMGQTAEVIAREVGITREQQDEYANNSHHKAVAAAKEGKFNDEIIPLIGGEKLDKILASDVGPRENSTVEGLAKMRPFFDRKSGTVTIGNACPITDGGSLWLMASESAVKKYNLEPMARMIDFHFHGLDPERMGLGPVPASYYALKRAGLTMDQMDLIELNEAFAAQVLGCVEVAKDEKLSQRFGCESALGEIPLEKLNVNGGAIALGHPVGSTGSRLLVTLAHEMKKRGSKYGLATLCIGGGQGGATIIERL